MKYFLANWKSYVTTLGEAENLAELAVSTKKDDELIILPSALHLSFLSQKYSNQGLVLGAQDVSTFSPGPYTGEVVGVQLFNLGVKYVLVGHSERRINLHEGVEILSEKLARAFENKICPVLCLGENKLEREQNRYEAVVKNQLEELAGALSGEFLLAYEPVWAIGTNETCSVKEAETMAEMLLSLAQDRHLKPRGVLYGGSVNPENFSSFWQSEVLAGVLVGSASADYAKLKLMLSCLEL